MVLPMREPKTTREHSEDRSPGWISRAREEICDDVVIRLLRGNVAGQFSHFWTEDDAEKAIRQYNESRSRIELSDE